MVLAWLKDAVANLSKMISDLVTGGNLTKLAAMSYGIASADGSVDVNETNKFVDIVRRAVPEKTDEEARAAFNSMRGKPQSELYGIIESTPANFAPMLVRAGVAIGKSDGDFSDPEKAFVKEVCERLFLNEKEFLG